MNEIHSEPLEELKYDIKPETLKKVKNCHIRSKSIPPTSFPSLLSSNLSIKLTSSKSSKGLPDIPDDFISGLLNKIDTSNIQKSKLKYNKEDDKDIKKEKKPKSKSTKILFKLISQEEADIYTEDAMSNLGFIQSDLEYPTNDEIHSFTNNPDLVSIVEKELCSVVDERKKKLEIEKRNIYFNNHLKTGSIFLIHSKRSPKKNRKSILDSQPSDFQMDNLNLSYGNGYYCSADFQRAVNSNEDKIRRVVSQHKKAVTKAVFDTLRTHYQCDRNNDANAKLTEKIDQTQKLNQTINEKNRDRYLKVKKERRKELNQKKQKLKEKSKKEDSRLYQIYSDRLNRATKLHFKNEEKAQHAAEVREENLLRTIDELTSKSQGSKESLSSYTDSSSVSASALVPQQYNDQSPRHQESNPPNSPNQPTPPQAKKKKMDELDLELHPEEPYSSPKVIKMIAMNKIIEREAKLYGRLAEKEEQRAIKKKQAQKEFDRKQKVIAEAREKQRNDRLSLQKRDAARMKQSEQRIDDMTNDYRQFLIKRSTIEAEKAIHLKKLKSDDLRARRKKAKEIDERERNRILSYTEMKREKINVFEEKRLMEDLRQSRAQKERLIFDRKEESRKRAREKKFRRNQEERKELIAMENEYVKNYENKIDRHISDFETIFASQMEKAKTDPNMLGKLAEMYDIDIDEIDARAQRASSSNTVPLSEYIESLKDAKNDVDINTAKEIIFETTNVRITPKDSQSESYIYSDYNSSFESDVE